MANVCSRNVPAFTLNVDDSSADGTAPAVTVVAPGGSTEPPAPFLANILRKYWAPNVVLDKTASDMRNCAVPLASKVYTKKLVRLLNLKPSRLLPKSEHWPWRQMSESTRFTKSI